MLENFAGKNLCVKHILASIVGVALPGYQPVSKDCFRSFFAITAVCATVKLNEICSETKECNDRAMIGSDMRHKSSDTAKTPI